MAADKTVTEVREDWAETINRVHYTQERVRITHRGRARAALISAEDLELLEVLEDHLDHELIRAALAESGDERIPHAEAMKMLGLDE